MAEILILDDQEQFCRMLAEHVRRAGHDVSVAHTLADGLASVRALAYDIVFLDVQLPDGSGLDILPELRSGPFPPEVIVVTGFGGAEGAELAIQHDAWDYVRKESSVQAMLLSLSRALKYRESRHGAAKRTLFMTADMIGQSPVFRAALGQAAQAAGSDVSVLVTGETGTGKELCATAIHENSARADEAFIVVDCTALPDTLVGSILFGHVQGAFTGANKEHDGLIKQADGGTLFLDEVGDMPMDIQKAFLRVLQERRYRPIGSEHTKTSDFRLIAATNRNLEQLADERAFRRDLLFRLRSLTVQLPPLRERVDDLPLLTTHFVAQQCRALGRDVMGVSESLSEALSIYPWPGNVRELGQAIASAVVRAGSDPVLYPNHLPVHIRSHLSQVGLSPSPSAAPAEPAAGSGMDFSGELAPLREMRGRFEEAYLVAMVKQAEHNIESACRLSGLSRPHVYALLKKHGLRL